MVRHKGLQAFFERGSKAGIQPAHVARLSLLLSRLDQSAKPEDMNIPGWRLHPLKADLKGHRAVDVNRPWWVTFVFEGVDAVLVDHPQYH